MSAPDVRKSAAEMTKPAARSGSLVFATKRNRNSIRPSYQPRLVKCCHCIGSPFLNLLMMPSPVAQDSPPFHPGAQADQLQAADLARKRHQLGYAYSVPPAYPGSYVPAASSAVKRLVSPVSR